MNRRNLLKSLVGLAALPSFAFANTKNKQTIGPTTAQPSNPESPKPRVHLQTSPIAGFQYYQGNQAWLKMQINDPLILKAELENRYDEKAVEIFWQDPKTKENIKLGYLPRTENTTISHLLQSGQTITAKIEQINNTPQPWQKMTIAVYL